MATPIEELDIPAFKKVIKALNKALENAELEKITLTKASKQDLVDSFKRAVVAANESKKCEIPDTVVDFWNDNFYEEENKEGDGKKDKDKKSKNKKSKKDKESSGEDDKEAKKSKKKAEKEAAAKKKAEEEEEAAKKKAEKEAAADSKKSKKDKKDKDKKKDKKGGKKSKKDKKKGKGKKKVNDDDDTNKRGGLVIATIKYAMENPEAKTRDIVAKMNKKFDKNTQSTVATGMCWINNMRKLGILK